MNVKILTPDSIKLDTDAIRIVAEGPQGYFCLLPRHVDCFSMLVPGIITIELPRSGDGEQMERFVATDQGVLVKRDGNVSISCRRAVVSTNLENVTELIRGQFLTVDERERLARSAAARLEAAFVRKFMEFELT